MFSNNINRRLLVLGCLLFSPWVFADEVIAPRLGQSMSADEVEAVSLTVLPSGQGLPAGRGSVQQGQKLYVEKCASCHGDAGNNGIVIALAGRPKNGSDWSAGSSWPYSTSLFDYIRRAMPPYAPKQLNANETYALTAYVLKLNGLVESHAVINAESLPKIKMPAESYTHNRWEKVERYQRLE